MKRSVIGAAVVAMSGLALTACSSEESEQTFDPTKIAFSADFGSNGFSTIPLSVGTKNRLTAVALGDGGSTYAAGYLTNGEDQQFALVKVGADGKLDPDFGNAGIATVNVSAGKTAEQARSLLVQDGKILVVGAAEHDGAAEGAAAKDTDIAVVRFDGSGQLDTSFGTDGIARIDLGPGAAIDEETFIGDNATGIVANPDGGLVLWGSKLAGPGRSDANFALVGLTDSGARDRDFGTDGVSEVDVADNVTVSAKNVIVHNDHLVAAGYAKGTDGVVRPSAIRTDLDGKLDQEFGQDGIATHQILKAVTEAYSIAAQGDSYVLTGYGRDTADEKVDMLAYRFTSNGELDKSFGQDGLTRIDHIGAEDRGRNLAVLDDGRILIVGAGTSEGENVNGMVVLLDKDGKPETGFGHNGAKLVDFGGAADNWFGVVLNDDQSAAYLAGFKGAPSDGPGHDDAVVGKLLLK